MQSNQTPLLPFAAQLKEYRLAVRLTQKELAERAQMSEHSISNLERGAKHAPRNDTIRLLAAALCLSPQEEAQFIASAQALRRPRARSVPPAAPLLALPYPAIPLIGREREVDAICALVQQSGVRLLNLCGLGGVGKTRLALGVAAILADTFAGEVYFVDLAPVRTHELVAPMMAQVLGLRDSSDQPAKDVLKASLAHRHVLLILDNFEHVAPAAVVLGELLAACPHLVILVTSRATLHVRGEHEFPIKPLQVPNLDQLGSLHELAQVPAVALFLEYASAVVPDFQLTAANAHAVATICSRLEGMPLALELAAPWIRLLAPRELLTRLEPRLALLTGGAHDLPERQRTMRTTLAWSYDLLPPAAQHLFRCLAVFVGGCTLDMLQIFDGELGTNAISSDTCSEHPSDTSLLDQLNSLVEHHLMSRVALDEMSTQDTQDETALDPDGNAVAVIETGETGQVTEETAARFLSLETVREYALTQLHASGEHALVQQAHARACLHLALRAHAKWQRPEQEQWLNRIEQDLHNMRAALHWATEHEHPAFGLQLASALAYFWRRRGYFTEGRSWLRMFLSDPRAQVPATGGHTYEPTDEELAVMGRNIPPSHLRATACHLLGTLARAQGDYAEAERWFAECLTLAETNNSPLDVIRALYGLGELARSRGDTTQAQTYFERALACLRLQDDPYTRAQVLNGFGLALKNRGEYARAVATLEEALALCHQVGAADLTADVLNNLAISCLEQHHYVQAQTLLTQSLAIRRRLGDKEGLAAALFNIGGIAQEQQQYGDAWPYFQEAMDLWHRLGNQIGLAYGLEALAEVATHFDAFALAVRLFAAAAHAREQLGAPLDPHNAEMIVQALAVARTALGETEYQSLRTEGSRWSLDQALAVARIDVRTADLPVRRALDM